MSTNTRVLTEQTHTSRELVESRVFIDRKLHFQGRISRTPTTNRSKHDRHVCIIPMNSDQISDAIERELWAEVQILED